MGKEVKSPLFLKNNKLPVLIAAVQSAPLIYKKYLQYNFDKELIIKKLII